MFAGLCTMATATPPHDVGDVAPPHVLFIVGDDVGYSDFGFFNDKKTITPIIDGCRGVGCAQGGPGMWNHTLI